MTYDFFGFLFGVIGAGLLALNRPSLSRWGFLFFLGSNVAWILYSFDRGEQWLLLQTLFYSVTSIVGVWQWLVKPRLVAARRMAMSALEHDVTSVVFMPRLDTVATRGSINAGLGKAI